jgi:NAD(P)-dependent dehydrogenase (short-subunit alcohol dehydrogenase family)
MDSRIQLHGQVALVTGAGRGIGRATACALATAGAEVAVLSRSADQVGQTAALITGAGGHALALTADVTDREAVSVSVQAVLDRFGRIDLLVNNAGANTVFGPVWEVDPDAWWADVRVNLLGPFLCSAAVLPAMVARRRGRIVNIASGTAGRAFPNNSAYAASKAALVRLTDCLSAEAAPHGISVFALGPGTVRSAISLGLERSAAGRRWLADAIAALRFVPAEVPAAAVVLLATGLADELSGRWLDAADDIRGIAAQAADVRAQDLFQLRRTKLPAGEKAGT